MKLRWYVCESGGLGEVIKRVKMWKIKAGAADFMRLEGFRVTFWKEVEKKKNLDLESIYGVWLVKLGALIFLIFLDRDRLALFSQRNFFKISWLFLRLKLLIYMISVTLSQGWGRGFLEIKVPFEWVFKKCYQSGLIFDLGLCNGCVVREVGVFYFSRSWLCFLSRLFLC